MPGPGKPPRAAGVGLAVALLLLLLAGLAGGPVAAQDDDGPAVAQDESDAARAARWGAFATEAQERIEDPRTSTDELEALREQLVDRRAEALAAGQAKQPAVDELNQRLQAIGPPPADGTDEAPEVAALRRDLQAQITEAQAPVQTAEEAARRADTLIDAVDRTVRGRFSAELMSRAASPLLPSTWLTAFDEIHGRWVDYRTAFSHEFDDPETRRQALRSLPVKVALMIAGIAIAFAVRHWLTEWLERRLEIAPNRRSVAWLVALRNLARLVVPTVGAGLIFAAFDPAGLIARADEGRFFSIPRFVLILIGAGWLAGSLLAPSHKAFRLVPLDDTEAWKATRTLAMLGIAVSFAFLFAGISLRWNLSTSTQSALQFPLVLLGAVGLWRAAAMIDVARRRLAAPAQGDRPDSATAVVALRFLKLLAQVLRGVAIAAPLIGAAGYLPLAGFLVFRTALTLGVLGGGRVVFDFLNKTAQVLLVSPTAQQRDDDGGLIPVGMAALVGLAALPLLAIVWGARPSDIADFWRMLREGVTLGGIRLSATALVTLVLVFALGFGMTRLLQTLLRGTVLPRTKLDTGGRNAVLAGVGYVGFAVSVLVAVAAAGLDLSSLAIVAGALSVGIGFGMQNIVSNFVSGIILLVERPVKEGDWIEVGGFSGYVRGINVRSTEIETFDRASVILPNSDLIAGTVLNRTHKGKSGRLQVPVGVTYDADPKKVEAILLSIAEENPLVLEDPAPRVLFLELGPDSMNFELRCWLRDVNFSLSVRSDMNYDIVSRFADEGIRAHFYGRDLPEAAPAEPMAVTLQRARMAKET